MSSKELVVAIVARVSVTVLGAEEAACEESDCVTERGDLGRTEEGEGERWAGIAEVRGRVGSAIEVSKTRALIPAKVGVLANG